MILSLFMFVTLSIVAAISIEVARIELAETELRVATDSCARLAMSKLALTQDETEARNFAINNAHRFTVGGQPFALAPADLAFGSSRANGTGTHGFLMHGWPRNAVRINSAVDRLGSQQMPVAFGGLFGDKQFELTSQAVAANSDIDVVLVLDRSASMAFDMIGVDFQYPSPGTFPDAYFELPHATESRWAAMERAMDVFVQEMNAKPTRTKVGLSSYSSDNDTWHSDSNGVYHHCVSVAATKEQWLTSNFSSLITKMQSIGNQQLVGGTNIAAGMVAGKQILDASNRITAAKVMIVLTDGFYNDGEYPPTTATAIAADNVTIHTITFGYTTDDQTMQKVADNGGGIFYKAPDETTLVETFRKLARNLNVQVVK